MHIFELMNIYCTIHLNALQPRRILYLVQSLVQIQFLGGGCSADYSNASTHSDKGPLLVLQRVDISVGTSKIVKYDELEAEKSAREAGIVLDDRLCLCREMVD